MDRSKSFKFLTVIIFMFISAATSCIREKDYGTFEPGTHTWLRGKRIFIDPGHGKKYPRDIFRLGPGGITEEEVNLKVSLILRDMLRRSGAVVALSRESGLDVPLERRVSMAEKFTPDLLVSVHHNGSPRREDPVNYPCVLIWGTRTVRPASYDFAELLLEEFHKIMDERGTIMSDFAVFHETGTRILRETRHLCPGVIGEGGFFSDGDHAVRLKDPQYNEREAEAYFTAISRYMKWGIPGAKIVFSCSVDRSGFMENMITEKNPNIYLLIESGNELKGIYEKTLRITLDDIPVGFDRAAENIFSIRYGEQLYPGFHRIRFSFRNLRDQSSMVCSFPFFVEIHKGEYRRLVEQGSALARKKGTAREGLMMLQSALSTGKTDPRADDLLWDITRGFRLIGEDAVADYYLKKILYFYPRSRYRKRIRAGVKYRYDYRFPVDYYGKELRVYSLEDMGKEDDLRKMNVIKYFFIDNKK